MYKGMEEVENISNPYNISIINGLINTNIKIKQDEQRLVFPNPLNANYEGNHLEIHCTSSYNSNLNAGQINTTFSGASPAEYRFSETTPGIIILGIIENTIKEFSGKGKNMKINLTAIGYSDGLNVKDSTKYDGKLGDDITIPFRNFANPNKKDSTRFIKNQTYIDRKGLDYAKLRAYDIVNYLQRRFRIDDIEIYVVKYDEIGPEYRGSEFFITIEDVLLLKNEELKNLRWYARPFIPK